MSSLRSRKGRKKGAQDVTEDSDATAPLLKETSSHPKPTASHHPIIGRVLLGTVVISLVLALGIILVPNVLDGWFHENSDESFGQFLPADEEKQQQIVEAFKYAWSAYERDAFGDDEYHPLSRRGTNLSSAGAIGYTLVDALDTMLLMGLDDEYSRARDWVDKQLTFDRNGFYSTFETTIRVLGGLLSAYYLTNDGLYIERAIDLGDRLLPAFDTPRGLPHSYINLATGQGQTSQGTKSEEEDDDEESRKVIGMVSTAEVSTIQLEFKYLSYLTEGTEYWKAAERVMDTIRDALDGRVLASTYMDHAEGLFVLSPIRMGSRVDSYYEYLLKQYLLTGRRDSVYRNMFDSAMDGLHDTLLLRTPANNLLFTAELNPERNAANELTWRRLPKQEHLACFLGGVLMLGATNGGHGLGEYGSPISIPPIEGQLPDRQMRDWKTGKELLATCWATHDTATGLAPEIAYFRQQSDPEEYATTYPHDWYIQGSLPGEPVSFAARYMLRPETIESLFVAYRLTGDPRYRSWGWKIFQAIEQYCKLPSGGYASVVNVDSVPVEWEDKMEGFMLSETLKYLWLLFSDNTVLPLKDVVFNTEGHPLPIFKPKRSSPFY